MKKLKSMKKPKKCKCGCNIVTVKAAGGKMIEKCACGCETKKHKKGGALQKKQEGGEVKSPVGTVAKNGTKVNRIAKAQEGKTIKKKTTPKIDKGPGNGETWETSNIGTGNNSMNPKDWSKNKPTQTKKVVTKKPLPTKKESGGLIDKIKCGGKTKAPDRVKKAKLKK